MFDCRPDRDHEILHIYFSYLSHQPRESEDGNHGIRSLSAEGVIQKPFCISLCHRVDHTLILSGFATLKIARKRLCGMETASLALESE